VSLASCIISLDLNSEDAQLFRKIARETGGEEAGVQAFLDELASDEQALRDQLSDQGIDASVSEDIPAVSVELVSDSIEQAQDIGIDEKVGKAGTTLNQEPTDIDALRTQAANRAVRVPTETVTAYKLFRIDPRQPGLLFPLYVDAKTPVEVGVWTNAQIGEATKNSKKPNGGVQSAIGELAFRPGWHAGDLPVATHIGGKVDLATGERMTGPKVSPTTREPFQVWAEVEMPNDVNWQAEADSRAEMTVSGTPNARTAHITDQLPIGGFYKYKTNSNMTGSWMIGGEMKVVKVLSDLEVDAINADAGVSDLPRTTDRLDQVDFIPQSEGLEPAVTGLSQDAPDDFYTPGAAIGDEHTHRIASRLPTTARATEDPLTTPLVVDLASMKNDPGKFAHNMDLIAGRLMPSAYVGFRPTSTEPDAIAQEFIAYIVDNLLWVHDQIDPTTRARSKQWYVGANNLANRLSSEYNMPLQAVAAVMAALSPQKDWFQNASLGERLIDIHEKFIRGNMTGFTPDAPMVDWATQKWLTMPPRKKVKKRKTHTDPKKEEAALIRDNRSKDKRRRDRAAKQKDIEVWRSRIGNVLTTPYADLSTGEHRAIWLRVYDEAHNPRGYRTLTPEGNWISDAGGKVAWNSFVEIGKGINALLDPSFENLTAVMGNKNKVRNFYNNILAPNNMHGDVTIDTHAVAVGLLRGLSGNSAEVHHNFGSSPMASKRPDDWVPAKNDNDTGAQGTYGIWAEAYRAAADARGLKPREMQSITWEAVRGLFTASFKQSQANVDRIDNVWKDYDNKTLTLQEARTKVLDIANGFNEPEWIDARNRGDEEIGSSSYDGELPTLRVRRRGTGGGSGAGTGNTGGNSLEQSGTPGVGPGTSRRRLFSPTDKRNPSGVLETFELGDVSFQELAPEAAERFHTAISEAVAAMGSIGASVEVKSVEDLAAGRMLLTPDGSMGVMVKPDGDITSVFKHPDKGPKGAMRSILQIAIESGGTKMDAFDGFLPRQYAAFGFVAEARIPWADTVNIDGEDVKISPDAWDKKTMEYNGNSGEPDVVFMRFSPDEAVAYEDGSGQMMADYDAAFDFRDSQMVETVALEQAAPPKPGAPRGQFTPSRLGVTDQNGKPTNIIAIFEGADRTTFLHESGHLWLEQLREDAADFGGQLSKDWTTVQNWWADNADSIRAEAQDRAKSDNNVEALDRISGMSDLAIIRYIKSGKMSLGTGDAAHFLTVAMHEQFARGTEAYFRAGQAPSLALSDAFAHFSAWIGSVYRTLSRLTGRNALNVQFSEEVIGVMDRLLASEEEISQVMAQYNMVAMFDTQQSSGMNNTQWQEYVTARVRAPEEAKARQVAKRTREIERQQLEWWKSQKEDMRFDMEEEVAQEPSHRLLYAMLNPTLADGSEIPHAIRIDRLDKKALIELIGIENLNALPRLNGLNMYVQASKKNDTVALGPVADLFGYASAQEMIDDLITSQPFDVEVDQRLDARMEAEHGSMKDNAPEEAIASVHTGGSISKVLAMELAALRTTEVVINDRFMAAHAKLEILKIQVSKIRPSLYLTAEKRHARASASALNKGDRIEAYRHKFQQIKNHHLAKEAMKAQSKIKTDAKSMLKYKSRKRKWKGIDPDYLDAIRLRLDAVSIGPRMTEKTKLALELQAFNTWIEAKKENDDAILEIPERIRNAKTVINYQDMTLEDFNDLKATVTLLAKQGRLKNKLLLDGEKVDRQVVINSLLERLSHKNMALNTAARNKWASSQDAFSGTVGGGIQVLSSMDASLLKIEMLLNMIDGEPNGPWHQALFQPFADAEAMEKDMQMEVNKLVSDGLDAMSSTQKKALGRRVDIGALALPGEQWTRSSLIMFALNTGNDSNLDKMIRGEAAIGRNINEQLVQETMQLLNAEEVAFVQSVWDHAEKLFPEVEAIARRETGQAPERMIKREVETAHGTMAGGYFPMMYDPTRSKKGRNMEARDALQAMQSQTVQASVNSSMTKERTQGFSLPIELSIQNLTSGFDKTIHYISHYDAVRQANQILSDPILAAEMRAKLGTPYLNSIEQWVGHVATGGSDRIPVPFTGKITNAITRNTTVAVLGFSYSTMMAQALGYTAAVDRLLADTTYGPISAAIVMKDLSVGIGLAFSPSHRKEMYNISGAMRHRIGTSDRDLQRSIHQFKSKSGAWARVAEMSLVAIAAVQLYIVDIPVWYAAYNRASKAEPGNIKKAVQYADRVVRLSQSSAGMKDLAAVQQSKGWKAFTMFYSFMNLLYGILRDAGHETKAKDPRTYMRFAARILVVITAQEVLYNLMREGLPEPDEAEDEEADTEFFVTWAAKRSAMGIGGTVPVIRDFVEGFLGDYGYEISPITSFGKKFIAGVETAADTIDKMGDEDEEPPEADDYRKMAVGLALVRGLPATQADRFMSGLIALFDDDIEDASVFDLLTGYEADKE
jgi:hypothetical protein